MTDVQEKKVLTLITEHNHELYWSDEEPDVVYVVDVYFDLPDIERFLAAVRERKSKL